MNRKPIPSILAFASLFLVPLPVPGGWLSPREEPSYTSRKPLYVKFALTKDGSKILSVVFDESRGTGTGYDVVYVDPTFSGNLGHARKVKARVKKQPQGLSCFFPLIDFDLPPRAGTGARSGSSALELRYFKRSARQYFHAETFVSIRQGSTTWRYFFADTLNPAGSLAKAPVWRRLSQCPKLEIETKPDRRKGREGCLGLALSVLGDGNAIGLTKGLRAPIARVEIKKPNGEAVHKLALPIDKFGFG